MPSTPSLYLNQIIIHVVHIRKIYEYWQSSSSALPDSCNQSSHQPGGTIVQLTSDPSCWGHGGHADTHFLQAASGGGVCLSANKLAKRLGWTSSVWTPHLDAETHYQPGYTSPRSRWSHLQFRASSSHIVSPSISLWYRSPHAVSRLHPISLFLSICKLTGA